MLIKHSTATARSALFPQPALPPEAEPGSPQPSAQDIEIARLEAENASLHGEIAQLRAAWQGDLQRVEQRARESAAQDHVRDDAKRLQVLVKAVEGARQDFERELLPRAGQWATQIATLALEKLVARRQADDDWLARVIGQRLSDLDRDTIVALNLSPADLDRIPHGEFQTWLPSGVRIEADPVLRPGVARLQLRLGSVDIDPAEGFARLRGLLDAGGEDD